MHALVYCTLTIHWYFCLLILQHSTEIWTNMSIQCKVLSHSYSYNPLTFITCASVFYRHDFYYLRKCFYRQAIPGNNDVLSPVSIQKNIRNCAHIMLPLIDDIQHVNVSITSLMDLNSIDVIKLCFRQTIKANVTEWEMNRLDTRPKL